MLLRFALHYNVHKRRQIATAMVATARITATVETFVCGRHRPYASPNRPVLFNGQCTAYSKQGGPGCHLIHGSLGLCKSTGKRHIGLRGCFRRLTDVTNRPRYVRHL